MADGHTLVAQYKDACGRQAQRIALTLDRPVTHAWICLDASHGAQVDDVTAASRFEVANEDLGQSHEPQDVRLMGSHVSSATACMVFSRVSAPRTSAESRRPGSRQPCRRHSQSLPQDTLSMTVRDQASEQELTSVVDQDVDVLDLLVQLQAASLSSVAQTRERATNLLLYRSYGLFVGNVKDERLNVRCWCCLSTCSCHSLELGGPASREDKIAPGASENESSSSADARGRPCDQHGLVLQARKAQLRGVHRQLGSRVLKESVSLALLRAGMRKC